MPGCVRKALCPECACKLMGGKGTGVREGIRQAVEVLKNVVRRNRTVKPV